MSRRSAFVAFAVLLATMFIGRSSADSREIFSIVLAVPANRHPGDPVYLSGAGFKAKDQELITVGCPALFGAQDGTIQAKMGPRTDKNGEFKAYSFPTTVIPNLRGPLECTVYASAPRSDGSEDPIGVEVKGSYTLYPQDQRLGRCDINICATVKPSPVRVRSGLYEHVRIHAWPGSTAQVQVKYPASPVLARRATLDWRGNGTVTFAVHAPFKGSARSLTASIKVRMSLMTVTGTSRGQFTVTR